jgi:hypothetical protein
VAAEEAVDDGGGHPAGAEERDIAHTIRKGGGGR